MVTSIATLRRWSLMSVQDDAQLQSQRDLNAANRPCTRAQAGFVFRWVSEWYSEVDFAFEDPAANKSGWDFSENDKQGIQARADFYGLWCILRESASARSRICAKVWFPFPRTRTGKESCSLWKVNCICSS